MIRLSLLGPQDARDAEGRAVRAVLAQPKRFALLAYLAVEAPKGPRRRDELLALFWPEADESRARRALTYALYFLRRELGQDVIVRHGADDLTVATDQLWTDVGTFEQAIEDGRLEEALALYRGDFMDGFYAADAPGLEQWADARRLRTREQARTATWALIESARRERRAPDGARWARRALELAPDDERALRELLGFLHAMGDVAGANVEYEHFAKRYHELHGAPPSPRTRALRDELRAMPSAPVASRVSLTVVSAPQPPPKEAPTDAIVIRRPTARPRWLAAVASACALGAIGIAYAFGRPSADAIGSSESVVAVLPFAYHGAPELAYTSDGVATLLSAGLDRLGSLRAVNPRVLLGARSTSTPPPVTPGDAAAIVRRYGAREFVIGDITESGRRLRVTATVYDDRSRVIEGPTQVEGSADSLFELVDRLTARIAATRPGETRADVSSALANGTRSIPALRAFLEGERNFRAAQYDAAIVSYRRAVAADSGFALALLRMSQAANWTGDYRLQRMADDRVQQLAHRLAPRDRARAEAWHLGMTGAPQRSESLYTALVREDPTDVEAWYYLADLVFHGGPRTGRPATESRPAWERVLALEPDDATALIHLIRLEAASHDSVAFDSLARRLSGLDASEDIAFELRGLRAYSFGDSAARATIAREAALRPGKLEVAVEMAGHLTGAAYDARGLAAFWRAIDNEPPAFESHGIVLLHRASVELAAGRLRRASLLMDSASVSVPGMALRYRAFAGTTPWLPAGSPWSRDLMQRARDAISRGDTIGIQQEAPAWRALATGLLAARRGDAPAARRASTALDAISRGGLEQATQIAPLLRGEVANLDGRAAGALAALGPAPVIGAWNGDPSTHLVSGNERWLRAELLARLGRDREALRLLASIPAPTGGDVAYAPAAHLRQGELLEKLGERGEAAAHYRRAVAYWRDADPELAPLARRANEGLKRVSRGSSAQ